MRGYRSFILRHRIQRPATILRRYVKETRPCSPAIYSAQRSNLFLEPDQQTLSFDHRTPD